MYKKILGAFAVLLLGVCIIAAKPSGITHLTSLWVGDPTDTATVTPGANDAFISGTFGVGDTTQLEGAVTCLSTLSATTITGTGTEFGTGTISSTEVADIVRYYQLPLTGFAIETGGGGKTVGTATAPLTASTAPGLELDDKLNNVVWADGETSPIQTTFRVPGDYSSGGGFKLLATTSGATTDNMVDFDVYINSDGTAADTSADNQTPVLISATPDEVSLIPSATDFSTLAAGHWVTLRLWREDSTSLGTGDLEVKGVTFYYTAIQ
jgi:hypothetical protein